MTLSKFPQCIMIAISGMLRNDISLRDQFITRERYFFWNISKDELMTLYRMTCHSRYTTRMLCEECNIDIVYWKRCFLRVIKRLFNGRSLNNTLSPIYYQNALRRTLYLLLPLSDWEEKGYYLCTVVLLRIYYTSCKRSVVRCVSVIF